MKPVASLKIKLKVKYFSKFKNKSLKAYLMDCIKSVIASLNDNPMSRNKIFTKANLETVSAICLHSTTNLSSDFLTGSNLHSSLDAAISYNHRDTTDNKAVIKLICS